MGNFRIYGGVNTSAPTQIVQSSATTWGALKAELLSQGIMNGNMSAAIKENQVGLSVDGYTLPVGIGTGRDGQRTDAYDFTVVLTASKMKSGGEVSLVDVEETILAFRHRLHEEIDEALDDMVDTLQDDGLDIEVSNTYADTTSSSDRVVSTSRDSDCDDCAEFQKQIAG